MVKAEIFGFFKRREELRDLQCRKGSFPHWPHQTSSRISRTWIRY